MRHMQVFHYKGQQNGWFGSNWVFARDSCFKLRKLKGSEKCVLYDSAHSTFYYLIKSVTALFYNI